MGEPARNYHRYLDPAVLAKLGGLELRARLILEGYLTGMHRSPHRGIAVEFAAHRSYTQGDDIRHLDWKLYGKTDKFYIKEYEQETNLEVVLLVDCSESMSYQSAGAPMSKHDYAVSVVASLSYLALSQRDSVGLGKFDEHLTSFLKPSTSTQHWKILIHELEGKTGKSKTSIRRVLNEFAERLNHRVLVILVSDLLDDVEEMLIGLKQLRYRRHEVIVYHLLDPAELRFPFKGPTRFVGMESAGEVLTDPSALRDRYLDELSRYQSQLQAGCSRLHIDYSCFDTSAPLDSALTTYLTTRSARIRQRSSRVLSRG